MTWETFYLSCFGIGLVLSVLCFAGGFGHVHLGQIHFGPHHIGRGHANTMSPVNGFTAMAFLCWFGGAGYLFLHSRLFLLPVVFLFAALSGMAGAGTIFYFLAKVLLPRERVLLPEDTEMRGVVARVSSTLRPNGTGEILFSQNGSRRSAAARAEDGSPIARDAQVLVLRYERGIAWVRPFDDLS